MLLADCRWTFRISARFRPVDDEIVQCRVFPAFNDTCADIYCILRHSAEAESRPSCMGSDR